MGKKIQPCGDKALMATTTAKPITINEFHRRLGHPSETITKETAQYMGIPITGKLDKCTACGIDKARQKNMNKSTTNKSTIPGE